MELEPLIKDNLVNDLIRWKKLFIEDLRVRNYSNNTIELYSKEIDYFIEYSRGYVDEMDINDINRPYIQGSLAYREEISIKDSISSNTKQIYIKALKQFFIFITENNREYKDYTTIFRKIKIVTQTKEKEYLTEQEISKLLNYLEVLKSRRESIVTFRNVFLIKLLLYSGLRISEALQLKFTDFEEIAINNTYYYQIKVKGKGQTESYAYVPKELIEDEYLYLSESYSNKHNNIFITRNGSILKRQDAYKIITNIYKKAGINKTGIHLLRHTFAMKLVNAGVDLLHIKELLRHKNVNSTLVYAKSTQQMVDESFKKSILNKD
ncbi:site-specific recombinase, phage integrase family (plasmid) [Deferribacter desulfuricans SSM1]|uniref:Site-specific recombinase, phage integrase family n=1 Tax=Deferribacter desulfuricans (strain DSM 14783 / JCM 11476 / NBRC 101012 / SSM1) TaxID=639282 RepID=D3PEP8_DEFDS|nr:tyrosine-type recombinase/integrase [Deferribacter desulfuricans]BAI81690.1 site-specific recombinase, phage integrase family [Deferribacter desulfuricans SSM1]